MKKIVIPALLGLCIAAGAALPGTASAQSAAYLPIFSAGFPNMLAGMNLQNAYGGGGPSYSYAASPMYGGYYGAPAQGWGSYGYLPGYYGGYSQSYGNYYGGYSGYPNYGVQVMPQVRAGYQPIQGGRGYGYGGYGGWY